MINSKPNIRYDKTRLIHNETCCCNLCLDAIVEGYGFKEGDLVEHNNRTCKVHKILPPSFTSTCKIMLADIDTMWCDWIDDDEINKLVLK